MACRVRVRIRRGDRLFEGAAPMNSGFKTDSPDIAIPFIVAQQLNLWPPDPNSDMIIIETGGGEVSNPLLLILCRT